MEKRDGEKNGRVGKRYKGRKRESRKGGERQEADRAEEIPGQKGRVEGQKEEQRGEEERKKEEREDEGVKVGKGAEDGDKCDRDRMLGKVRQIWGKRDGEFGWAEKRGSSSRRFGWGPIGGVSQNGGRRGEENDEGKRGVKKWK